MTKLVYSISFFLLLTFFCCPLFGQVANAPYSTNDAAVSSPTAASLGEYGRVPVSLYNGIPNINVPIIDMEAKGLSLPVSLSYHASGIRVNQLASWVGLGWSLNAGGVITREIRDQPDDLKELYNQYMCLDCGGFGLNYDCTGILQAGCDVCDGVVPNCFLYLDRDLSDVGYLYHGQEVENLYLNGANTADEIEFAFGNQTNIITADTNQDPSVYANSIGATIISVSQNSPSAPFTWTIVLYLPVPEYKDTEPDVFSFNFGNYSGSFVFDKNGSPKLFSDQDLKIEYTLSSDANLPNNDPDYTGTGLVSNYGGAITEFVVTTPDGIKYYFNEKELSYSDSRLQQQQFPASLSNFISDCSPQYRTPYHFDLNEVNATYTSWYLKEVKDPYDNLLFTFGYDKEITVNHGGLNQTLDVCSDKITYSSAVQVTLGKRLKDISWGFNSDLYGKLELDALFLREDLHSPFGTNTFHGFDKPKRLDKIKWIGADGTTLIKEFDFGYGCFGETTLNCNIPPLDFFWVTAHRKRLRLESLTHRGNADSEEAVYDFYYNLSALPPRHSAKQDFWGFYSALPTTLIPSIYAYTDASSNNQFNNQKFQTIYSTYPRSIGSSEYIPGADRSTQSNTVDVGMLIGLHYPTGGSTSFDYESNEFTEVGLQGNPIQGGGIRISEITDTPISTPTIRKRYKYLDETETFSSGKLIDMPLFARYKNSGVAGCNTIQENTTISSGAYTGLTTTKGGYVGYSTVMEEYVESPFASEGKVVYKFSTSGTYGDENDDCAGGVCVYNRSTVESNVVTTEPDKYPYPPNPNYDWNRGLLLKESYYNRSDVLVKNTDYQYDLFGAEKIYAYKVASEVIGQTPLSQVQESYAGKYYYISGDKRPTLITTTEYGSDGTANIVTENHTEYDSPSHHFPTATWTTNSDGKIYHNNYEYVTEAPSSTVNTERINRFMIAEPTEMTMSVGTTLNNLSPVDGTKIDYAFYNSTTGNYQGAIGDDPRPYQDFRYEKSWTDSGTPITGVWDLQKTIDNYDTSGFPKDITKNHWQTESYQWAKGKVTQRTYEDFTWGYTYYPDTRLLWTSTDIDGQVITYTYDGLQRLTQIRERNDNVITDIDYELDIGDFTSGFKNSIHTTVTYTPVSNSGLVTRQSKQYLDGLGRQVQNIQIAHSPNSKDVIVAQEYDIQGRLIKVYEPFEGISNIGDFDPNYTTQPFTETTYELSPLNRVISVIPSDWYANTYSYGSNNEIILTPTDTYAANELFCVTSIDPNGNKGLVFTDKRGRTVLNRRADNSGTEAIDTEYSYDDKDRAAYIFPPSADLSTPNLIFEYVYDGADNVVMKKMPDGAATHYVYNDRDLLVGMENGVLNQNGMWRIMKYDNYGREVESGLGTSTGLNTPNNPTILYNLKNTFYDDYISAVPINTGKIARTEVKQLDDNGINGIWMNTNYFYDIHGRTNQTIGNSHINTVFGSETRDYTYDYADNITSNLRTHTPDNINYFDIDQRNSYDHEGRLESVNFSPQGAEPEISRFSYTVKDELKQKQLGYTGTDYLQNVDYLYNTQGWLKSINSINSVGGLEELACEPSGTGFTQNPILGNSSSDLFHLAISYDYIDSDFGYPTQLNGNISQIQWRVQGRKRQIYGFNYDYQDRLTEADYGRYDDGIASLEQTNRYSSTYNYDDRGNITQLTRQGLKLVEGCYEQGLIDYLDYVYSPNSNQIRLIGELANSDCVLEKLVLAPQFTTQTISARNLVRGTNFIHSGANTTYQAEQCVELNPTFEVELGAEFLARIAPCDVGAIDFSTEGFEQTSSEDYMYDKAGNMTYDPNKGFTIEYNWLNLPYRIDSSDGTKQIFIQYDANGDKLSKIVRENNVTIYTQDYVNGVEYKNDVLEAAYHSDGKVLNKGSNSNPVWEYQFYLTDHLGNNRVVFKDDGTGQAEMIQESHPYPFGMAQKGMFVDDSPNKYKYNGKEFTNDFGVDWYEYGARNYRPDIGRFVMVDPLANHISTWSPYSYTFNNPILFIDPDGRLPIIPVIAGIWAAIEVGLTAYDVYDVATTVTDPNATTGQKLASIGGATAGLLLPGGGYSAADDVVEGTIKIADGYADDIVGKALKEGGDAGKTAKRDIVDEGGQYARPGSTGKVGEDYLNGLGGEAQKFFPTKAGKRGRVVDQFVNGVAHEAKTGYQSLTAEIAEQITKDAELLKNPTSGVSKVVWNFFESPVTGKVGASKPLQNALKAAGIQTKIIK